MNGLVGVNEIGMETMNIVLWNFCSWLFYVGVRDDLRDETLDMHSNCQIILKEGFGRLWYKEPIEGVY